MFLNAIFTSDKINTKEFTSCEYYFLFFNNNRMETNNVIYKSQHNRKIKKKGTTIPKYRKYPQNKLNVENEN